MAKKKTLPEMAFHTVYPRNTLLPHAYVLFLDQYDLFVYSDLSVTRNFPVSDPARFRASYVANVSWFTVSLTGSHRKVEIFLATMLL